MPLLSTRAMGSAKAYGFTASAGGFSLIISTNQTNVNLRSLAVSSGWNQASKVSATINSGVVVYSTSTGTPAMTISGSFPGGVELVNNGVILGKGGAGGTWNVNSGYGYSGGLALSVSTAVSINNANRIAGGGGGGGGAAGGGAGGKYSPGYGGGGGGGGIGNGAGGAGQSGWNGGSSGSPGSAGTLTSAGSGGGGYIGTGGSGGSYGASGGTGSYGGGGGGSGGGAVAGNSYITWIATGTRNGGIS